MLNPVSKLSFRSAMNGFITLSWTASRPRAICVGSKAFAHLFKTLSPWMHTLTADNGRKFSQYQKIGHALNAEFYLVHSLASWAYGLNESTNGIIHQYFPKRHDITTITQQQVEQVKYKTNNRIRKCLGIKTLIRCFSGLDPALH